MGWIAFWCLVVFINLASLIDHIVKDTMPWFSLVGLIVGVAALTYNVVRYYNEQE